MMKCLPVLLALCFLFGCISPPTVKTPEPVMQPALITNLPNQSVVLTLLQASAEFDTFNTVRTNDSLRVNFTNVIHILDKRISTVDCNTTTLKNELLNENSIISLNLNSVFNLLGYYSQTQTNCLVSLQVIKTGIQQGLAK